jgi:hypothetical protein
VRNLLIRLVAVIAIGIAVLIVTRGIGSLDIPSGGITLEEGEEAAMISAGVSALITTVFIIGR